MENVLHGVMQNVPCGLGGDVGSDVSGNIGGQDLNRASVTVRGHVVRPDPRFIRLFTN